MQKAIIVYTKEDYQGKLVNTGMKEVNELLEEGWTVVSVTPMGGAAAAHPGNGNYQTHNEYHKIAFASMFVLTDQKDSVVCNI